MDVIYKEGMLYLQVVKFGKVSFIDILQIQCMCERVNIVSHYMT